MTQKNDWAPPARSRIAEQSITLAGVLIPFLGLIAAGCLLWGRGLGWSELAILSVMYLATGLGVTVGFHRLFVHRSFEAVRPVKFALGVLGSMSMQGPLLKWAAIHRRHHQFSDEADDPHSPHHYGGGVRGVLGGLWHSHLGWMFKPDPPDLGRYVRDLHAQKLLRVVSRCFGLWVLLGLLIPAGLGWLLTGTAMGALAGFVWGGLVRIFLVHHVTWSVNSVCHLWGRRPFRGDDESRNNFLCGVLALGEGWHNNHHAFPTSARHGLRWWEFDASYLFIRLLACLGLARAVRVPPRATLQSKLAANG